MSDAPAAPVQETGVSPVTHGIAVEETPAHKVFAGNLAYTTTDDGLRAFFAPFESEIISVHIILRGTRSAGYGFVAMSSAEAVLKAVETLAKKELDGRQLVIEVAKPADQKDKDNKERRAKRRPGRRGGKAVPGEVSEAEANGEPENAEPFEVAAAQGTDEAAKPKKRRQKTARKPKSRSGEGDASDSASPAPDATHVDADASAPKKSTGRPRKPRVPRPPRPAGEDPVGEPSKSMLFVANLGFNIDDAGLHTLFTEAGIDVISARVVRKRWGQPRRSKGYGFVDVGNEQEQKKAIGALEGKEVGGRNIAVKVAVNTPHEEELEAPAEVKVEASAQAKVEAPAQVKVEQPTEVKIEQPTGVKVEKPENVVFAK